MRSQVNVLVSIDGIFFKGVRGQGCSRVELGSGKPEDRLPDRLPTDLSPYHTNLEIRPHIHLAAPPFPFEGWVDIWFDCVSTTNAVYLNTRNLEINPDSLEITVAEDSPVQPEPPQWVSFEIDDSLEFFIVHLDGAMVEGARYKLSVSYNGTLRDPGTRGMFWDSYDQDGET